MNNKWLWYKLDEANILVLFLRYSKNWKNGIHLSVVACGDRAEETIVLLKSAVLFTNGPLIFHIFAEFDLQPVLRQKVRTRVHVWDGYKQ